MPEPLFPILFGLAVLFPFQGAFDQHGPLRGGVFGYALLFGEPERLERIVFHAVIIVQPHIGVRHVAERYAHPVVTLHAVGVGVRLLRVTYLLLEEMLLAAEYAEPCLHDVMPPPLPFRGQHVAAFEQQRHRHLRLPALMGDLGRIIIGLVRCGEIVGVGAVIVEGYVRKRVVDHVLPREPPGLGQHQRIMRIVASGESFLRSRNALQQPCGAVRVLHDDRFGVEQNAGNGLAACG